MLKFAKRLYVGYIRRLNFSEPVQRSSLNATGLKLRTAETITTDEYEIALFDSAEGETDSGLYASCDDGLGNLSEYCSYVRFALSAYDWGRVRAVKAGAYLALDSSAARDSASNALSSSHAALAVATYVKDATAPTLVSYELDLDGAGSLVLNFSEPVDPLSLNVSLLQLRNSTQSNAAAFTLAYSQTAEVTGETSLRVHLFHDLIELKVMLSYYATADDRAIGKRVNSTFLSANAGFVTDLAFPGASNDAASVADMQVSTLKEDTTGPRLTGFELDLANKALLLYFDEPIDPTLVNFSAISLRSSSRSDDGTEAVRLDASTVGAVGNYPAQLAATLTVSDHLALLAASLSEETRAYLSHDGGVVHDVINSVAALKGGGPGEIDGFEQVFEDVPLGRPALGAAFALPEGPALAESAVDMDAGTLLLTFFHNVNVTKVAANCTALTLAGSDDASAWSHTLQNSTASQSKFYDHLGYSNVLVHLGKADLTAIKLGARGTGAAALFTKASNSWLAVSEHFVVSARGTKAVPRALGSAVLGAARALAFAPDATAPKPKRLSLDMDSGQLVFVFDEPVRAKAAVTTSVRLTASASSGANVSFTLTSNTQTLETGASLTATLQLGHDLNELKRLHGLADSRQNAFVLFAKSSSCFPRVLYLYFKAHLATTTRQESQRERTQ